MRSARSPRPGPPAARARTHALVARTASMQGRRGGMPPGIPPDRHAAQAARLAARRTTSSRATTTQRRRRMPSSPVHS